MRSPFFHGNMNTKYQETLDYLFGQLPMFQRIGPVAFKKNLTNTLALCAHLDDPQSKFPSIHIAGTNGKGSTAHLLSAVFQSADMKTGLYTSPHYLDFRERIKINGQLVPESFVIDFVNDNSTAFEAIHPSFFEITVALAFDYFAKEKVDIAIIETGLGGRLDSTNVISPLLSIITNISFDHQQFLGDTIADIATEKAGIIKIGVPVVIGEEQMESHEIFENFAATKGSKIYFADRHYQAELLSQTTSHDVYNVRLNNQFFFENLKVNLHGIFQKKNIQTALQTIEVINDLKQFSEIERNHIREGFANLKELTNFKGRWQLIGEQPTIICDSAHNEAGLKIAMKELRKFPKEKLHFVLGVVNDKAFNKILALFPQEAIYYFAKADIPRGLDAEMLKEQAAEFGLKGESYSSVQNALVAAKNAATENDLIYVGGSTFVVAEVI